MYIIQVDQQFWLKGIWRGWLMFCNSPSGAIVYRNLYKAEKAAEDYSKFFPASKFIVQPLSL